MKEAYVKFGTAQLLKEKGFDWDCHHFYYRKNNGKIVEKWMQFIVDRNSDRWINPYAEYISAPTQQMAMRWLRKRGIHIMPTIGCDVDRTPRIFYRAIIVLFNDYGDIDYRDPLDENGYDEPEDAIEAALQYVLTKLI